MSRFQKGAKRPENAGRKKGSSNVKTALLKDMILTALDESGGIEYLKLQAKNEPTAFLGLIGKILPKEIDANVKGEIKGTVTVKLV